jgi:hypothetical protein
MSKDLDERLIDKECAVMRYGFISNHRVVSR